MRAGQELVCIGCVGTAGTLKIIEDKRAELEKRFSRAYLDAVAAQAAGNQPLSVFFEADEDAAALVTDLYPVGKGGVLAALWNICAVGSYRWQDVLQPKAAGKTASEQTDKTENSQTEEGAKEGEMQTVLPEYPKAVWSAHRSGVGCEFCLDRFPVVQGTIELCELYELSPYRLYSAQAYLAASDNGGKLVARLEAAGYRAAVVGTLTKGKTRVRVDGEEPAFLTKEQRDELEKLFGKMKRHNGAGL